MKHIVFAIGLIIAAGMTFAEDGYLKSDGTQYINTGYIIKSTTRIELDIQLDSIGTRDQYLFGTYHNKSGALAFCSYTTIDGKMNYCCQKDTSNWRKTPCVTPTTRQTVILDGYHNRYSIVVGGVTNYTEAVTSPHADCDSVVAVPVLAGYNFNSGGRSGMTACKLYSLKIYEADILVADYKPCILDGELGFRDSISGILRKNAVGNPFTYGGDIEIIDGGYIESNGAQYIDTGYKANSSSRIEIDMAFSDLENVGDSYPFGMYTNPAKNDSLKGLNFGMFVNPSGLCGWTCQDGGPNWSMFSHSASLNRRTFVIDALERKWRVIAHGITVSSGDITTISADYDGETSLSLCLFAARTEMTIGHFTAMKLYGFRVYENGELVKNFVPCVKGGVVGLKETVGGKFFAGVVPGEAFTASDDVMVEEDDPYVEGHGFQAFATDIYVDSTCRVELDFMPEAVPNKGAKYFLGSTNPVDGFLVFGAYIENSQLSVNCQRNIADWNSVTLPNPDCRQQLIIDILNRKIRHYVNGMLFRSESITADCGTAENPIVTKYKTPILGNSNQGTEPGNILAARVYGFKLYKNDALVHDFKPYVKTGVVGMRDEVTGAFISTPREVKGFGAGGDIPSDTEGAFLSSDQRQAINTGYIVKDSSCIEVDFAFNQHTNAEERIFGSTSGGDYRIGVYGDSNVATWGTYRFAANRAGEDTLYLGSYYIDVKRRTAIIDIPNRQVSLLTGAETNAWRTIASAPQAGDEIWPMGLFGEPADADFTTAQHLANMRVYSVKIRENGTLVHHYLPYKSGDTVGLKDVVTGAIKTNMTGSEAPFTVGGCGWGEENAAFYEEPASKALDPDETVTLKAFAPGAVSYQWLKDGEEIEGANDASYPVSWQRHGLDAEYSVRAVFDRYGKAISRVSAPATVSHKPRGLHVIVR